MAKFVLGGLRFLGAGYFTLLSREVVVLLGVFYLLYKVLMI